MSGGKKWVTFYDEPANAAGTFSEGYFEYRNINANKLRSKRSPFPPTTVNNPAFPAAPS
jgi:hypothetical protein